MTAKAMTDRPVTATALASTPNMLIGSPAGKQKLPADEVQLGFALSHSGDRRDRHGAVVHRPNDRMVGSLERKGQ